jgi:hypothetical protein
MLKPLGRPKASKHYHRPRLQPITSKASPPVIKDLPTKTDTRLIAADRVVASYLDPAAIPARVLLEQLDAPTSPEDMSELWREGDVTKDRTSYPIADDRDQLCADDQKGAQQKGSRDKYGCPYRTRNPVRFNPRDYPACATQPYPDLAMLKCV